MIKSPITDGKKYYLKKRPGTIKGLQGFNFGAGQGRGIFYWKTTTNYIVVVGANVFFGNVQVLTLTTTTGPVGFAEYRDDSSNSVIIVDGVKGYILHSNATVTTITDINFPNPHIPSPVYLDGYIFLASPSTQTVHNSKLNDPTTWPSDGFIDTEMFPDNLVGLNKTQNYLACVGTYSIEWLYDNANPTGSPLQRNAPAVTQFGCPAPQTLVQTEKELILIGETAAGGRTVWVIDGFQPTEIATEPVREALDLEGGGILNATGFVVQVSGHKWYVVNLKTNQRTFVYDFEEQMWHEWTSGLGQSCFAFDYAADSDFGVPVLQGNNNATFAYNLNPQIYTDNNAVINCVITTSKIDFDTVKRKRIYRLSMVGDSPDGPTSVPIQVSWSDDDYNMFTTPTTLMLGSGYSTITQLGYTRRRAFQFVFQQSWPLRVESFELDIIQEVRR